MSAILVFGRNGQVATELQRLGGVVTLGRDQVDLSDPKTCEAAINFYRPRVVINAAAYTAVDRAEDEEVRVERPKVQTLPGSLRPPHHQSEGNGRGGDYCIW